MEIKKDTQIKRQTYYILRKTHINQTKDRYTDKSRHQYHLQDRARPDQGPRPDLPSWRRLHLSAPVRDPPARRPQARGGGGVHGNPCDTRHKGLHVCDMSLSLPGW